MKKLLLIGDLNDKLKSVLEQAQNDKLISHWINYQKYNEKQEELSRETGVLFQPLTNFDFVTKMMDEISDSEIKNDWVVMKGNIHTKDFLRLIIAWEQELSPDNNKPFLSHVVRLNNKKNPAQSFYLTDGALNVKQMEDYSVFIKIIDNASRFLIRKTFVGEEKLNVDLILAADNSSVPGYDIVHRFKTLCDTEDYLNTNYANQFNHVEIRQFDECFDLNSFLNKNPDADAESFSYPDLMVTPDITTANCIWKSLTILNDWTATGFLVGCELSVILLSRSDSEESYYESIRYQIKGE